MTYGVEMTLEKGRRIVRGLGFYNTRPVKNIREIVKNSARTMGSKTGFIYKKDGNVIRKTYRDLDHDVDFVGTALVDMGFKGKKIAILSENRYEWAVSYFAIVNGTGIGVPLDKYLPRKEVENLIERGGVEAVFYSGAYHDIMVEIADSFPSVGLFVCFDPLPKSTEDKNRFTTFMSLRDKGEALFRSNDRRFADAVIDVNAMSLLLFTSGTTNASKGVMLSHKNIASNVSSVEGILKIYPEDVHLSLLPLHHTFENTIGLLFMVHKGVCIAYSEGIRHIAQNIREFKVSVLVAVPAIFEAIHSKFMEGLEKSGKKPLVDKLISLSNGLDKLHIPARRKLLKSVLDKLGPNLRLMVSGAAPMNPEIMKNFQNFGITFLQGYGLTETSPVISATTEKVNKLGTIGVPVKGVEVTVDKPDENGMGEILARGKNVMLGYYENPDETKDVIDADGWFRTGDLGIIDAQGIIRITGRAKSMIVFTNGKKAFPEEYEQLLNSLSGIKETYVWGNPAPDGDIQVCAKIVLNREVFENQQITDTEKIGEILEKYIKDINQSLPKYKIIRYFVFSDEELIKTTKMTIKRPLELEKMKTLIESTGKDMRKLNKSLI